MDNFSIQKSNSSRKSNRTIFLSVIVIIFSGGIISGLFWLQHKATKRNTAHGNIVQVEPEQAEKNRNASIVKADELRNKWSSWAINHKNSLHAMLVSSDSNQAALLSVRDALPSVSELSSKTPISREDLGSHFVRSSDGSWRPNPDQNITVFTWHIAPRVADEVVLKQLSNEHERERFKRGQKFTARRQQVNFSKWHDIEIATSSNEGFQISLWASGRVTEQKWPVGRDRINNVHADTPSTAPISEISPPYDFLQ